MKESDTDNVSKPRVHHYFSKSTRFFLGFHMKIFGLNFMVGCPGKTLHFPFVTFISYSWELSL